MPTTPRITEYQTPTLEQHPNFSKVTGVILFIGNQLTLPGGVEQ